MSRRLLLCLGITLFITALSSCNNHEKAALLERLSTGYGVPESHFPTDTITVLRYYEAELAENKLFVNNLERIIQKGFDRQVDEFEKKELGFFASYKYMFCRVFQSKQQNEDLWRVKINRYFSNLEIEQDAYDAYRDYVRRVEALRISFRNGNEEMQILGDFPSFELPQQDVYLDAFSRHSLNNIFIEFGADIAAWLFVLLIICVLCLVGIKWTKGYSKVATIIAFIISLFLSFSNDQNMVASVRKQGLEITSINYEQILSTLNDTTFEYYDSLL